MGLELAHIGVGNPGEDHPTRVDPHRHQLVLDFGVIFAARQDAGAVPAPGDALVDVLHQLLMREAPPVLVEGLVIQPGDGSLLIAHRCLLAPERRRRVDLSLSYPPAPAASIASRPAPACTPAARAAHTCPATGRRGWAAAGPAAASRSGSTASAGSRTAPR